MKIRCDVCDKAEASVFCSADEAALCHGCDLHVHQANKLAGKHSRFSLLHPIKSESPICDICQERRALVFCQEDRAILCRDCDISIHEANEQTQKHSRFLLTGVKLSSSCFSYSSSSSNGCDAAMDVKIGSSRNCSKSPKMAGDEGVNCASMEKAVRSYKGVELEEGQGSDGGSLSASSISEYLETLPGWCVDEFLDPSVAANRFCKFHCNILAYGNQDLSSRHCKGGNIRCGITLKFLGNVSQSSSWNEVSISMGVSEQISFGSETLLELNAFMYLDY